MSEYQSIERKRASKTNVSPHSRSVGGGGGSEPEEEKASKNLNQHVIMYFFFKSQKTRTVALWD